MTTRKDGLTRRQYITATGAAFAAGIGGMRFADAQTTTIRQGYQTNMWGMPTYYLLRSGALEKRGLKFEEFAVPSGNLTMQQMVARQVDLGTYAGQSMILGHDKGGLVGIAVIEQVGKTAAVIARKDLNLKSVSELKGRKIGNQVGASTANIFTNTIAPQAGLQKSDWQEVRMNVNDMVAALAAKTIDAAVTVEPYNAIAEADGIANILTDFSPYDKMPVFMAATPDFVEQNPKAVVAYLQAWLDVARDFKEQPKKVAESIYKFYTEKGYKMAPETFEKALARVEVNPGFPADLAPYMQGEAEILLKAKRISAIPDWKKALRPDFMEKAKAGA
jgi:ABC-type nitrate/sulfonate/bicarbonate transport system substrate-binding protein